MDIEQVISTLAFAKRFPVRTVEGCLSNRQESATALLGQMEILVPMAGLIDRDAEIERLGKQIKKLETDLSKSTNKLANEKFVNNAPAAVVEKERDRVTDMQDAVDRFKKQLKKVESIQV